LIRGILDTVCALTHISWPELGIGCDGAVSMRLRKTKMNAGGDPMKVVHAGFAMLALLSAGCAHQVTFERPPPYSISGSRQDVGVTAIIDQSTLASKVPISSFMTGIANTWEVEPGDMLKQVADIELPQMFARYDFSNAVREPAHAAKGIILELAIPSYRFEDFRAKVSVSATAYEPGKTPLLQKTYSVEGKSQGEKMFWGGAFGMKSAIRQSSLDAYKKVFAELRSDLAGAIQSKVAASPAAVAAPDLRDPRGSEPPLPKLGRFSFEVEQVAKRSQCSSTPIATLTATGPGFENYSVRCANGDALAVRCDFGNCRALQ
jgi:hypothetical protein